MAITANEDQRLVSSGPEVKLVHWFDRPFDNAVATARTCYSSRLITDEEVALDPERRDRIAMSTFAAGHHTILQHAHCQFALSRVSRHFVWSFLHSHPFYNSEQVSQRYVEVKPDRVVVPPLRGAALQLFQTTVARQMDVYRTLCEQLVEPVERAYYKIFPARRKTGQAAKEIKKRAQEVARYVLPVATEAHLYHTVSVLTVLRYYRMCSQPDTPTEARAVATGMVEELLRVDPQLEKVLTSPDEDASTPEASAMVKLGDPRHARAFVREFDEELGPRVSKLVDHKPRGSAEIAQAVREVLGLPKSALDDEAAIRLALDPSYNSHLGDTMNVTTLSKLSRALVHAGYTFRKRLSHTADSQNQRHRMTPGTRPILVAHLTNEPDYVTPALLETAEQALGLYRETMEQTWEAMSKLEALGVEAEHRAYLLPNAVSVRFTESADLLHLHHKARARLCYLAQEEIWRATVDEVLQINQVDPLVGRYLLPPCGLRQLTATRPLCPEGERYCGVPVWKLRVEDYARVI